MARVKTKHTLHCKYFWKSMAAPPPPRPPWRQHRGQKTAKRNQVHTPTVIQAACCSSPTLSATTAPELMPAAGGGSRAGAARAQRPGRGRIEHFREGEGRVWLGGWALVGGPGPEAKQVDIRGWKWEGFGDH